MKFTIAVLAMIILGFTCYYVRPTEHQVEEKRSTDKVDYEYYNIAGTSKYLYVVSLHYEFYDRKEAQAFIEEENE